MPRICTICTHPERAEIDRLVLANEPNRRISAQYSITEQAIRRHKENHLPETLALAQGAAAAAHGDNLLAQVQDLQGKTLAVLAKAETLGDLPTVLKAVKEARGNVELLARLRGELQEQATTVNVLIAAPEWLTLRAAILRALEPHPEARAAVVAALGSAGNAGNG